WRRSRLRSAVSVEGGRDCRGRCVEGRSAERRLDAGRSPAILLNRSTSCSSKPLIFHRPITYRLVSCPTTTRPSPAAVIDDDGQRLVGQAPRFAVLEEGDEATIVLEESDARDTQHDLRRAS